MMIDRDLRLSEHFRLKEFLVSDTAPEIAASMQPTPYQLVSLIRVANLILEPTRAKITQLAGGEVSLIPTSGLRSESLVNALIKAGYPASKTSQHCWGEAVDFCPPYKFIRFIRKIFLWIHNNLPYCQLILYEDSSGKPKGNLHVSIAPLDGRFVTWRFLIDRDMGDGRHFYLPVDSKTGTARR